jgi:hypothetical protein
VLQPFQCSVRASPLSVGLCSAIHRGYRIGAREVKFTGYGRVIRWVIVTAWDCCHPIAIPWQLASSRGASTDDLRSACAASIVARDLFRRQRVIKSALVDISTL